MSDGTTKNNLRWFAASLASILCQRPKEEVVSDRAGGSSDGEQRKRAMAEVTRFSFRLAGGLISFGVAWIIFSRFVIPPIIESAYRGEGLPFLNSIISGQAVHPVEHYLASWQLFSWRILGIIFWVGLIPLPLIATGPEVQKYFDARYGKTVALKPEVANTLLALFGLALVFYLYYLHPVGYVYLITEDYWADYGSFLSWAMATCFLAWLLFGDRGLRKPGVVLLALGTFFVAMEEISWGQRILGIPSPTVFTQSNLQGEITLHNFVPNLSKLYVVAGIMISLWSLLLPVLTRKWERLHKWCNKWGIPIVPTHLCPFFLLAVFYLIWVPVYRSDEVSELFLGVAMVVLSLDLVLRAKRGTQVRGAPVTVATAGMTLILSVLTAFLVHFYSSPEELRNNLNDYAVTIFPKNGMHRQAEMLFDYLNARPQFLNAETRFRQALWLMERGEGRKAGMILELALDDQERFKKQSPQSSVPHRVAGQVLALLGRQSEAKAAFLEAIEKDRTRLERATDPSAQTRIRWSLGETFLAMGSFEEASEQLSMARALARDRKTQSLMDRWIRDNLRKDVRIH